MLKWVLASIPAGIILAGIVIAGVYAVSEMQNTDVAVGYMMKHRSEAYAWKACKGRADEKACMRKYGFKWRSYDGVWIKN